MILGTSEFTLLLTYVRAAWLLLDSDPTKNGREHLILNTDNNTISFHYLGNELDIATIKTYAERYLFEPYLQEDWKHEIRFLTDSGISYD